MSDDPFTLMQGVVLGTVLTQVVKHAKAVSYMAYMVNLYSDNRCTNCGYRNDHPFIIHDAKGNCYAT